MSLLAPYQSGVWLAEYLNHRCQLCRIYRSMPPAITAHPLPLSVGSHTLLAKFGAGLSRQFNSGLLCPDCHKSIMWLPSAFNVDIAAGSSMAIQAASYYDYPMRQAIGAFKQSEDMTKLPLLIHAIRQLPRPKGCHGSNSVIVPMPTTSNRLIRRGFDPVTVLSAYLAKHWQIPLWHGIQRIDNTVSQQGLSRAERLTNLNNAFMLTQPPPVKRLLLFDDVATTGASLQALARTLYTDNSANVQAAQSPTDNPTIQPTVTNPSAYQLSAYALAHGSHK